MTKTHCDKSGGIFLSAIFSKKQWRLPKPSAARQTRSPVAVHDRQTMSSFIVYTHKSKHEIVGPRIHAHMKSITVNIRYRRIEWRLFECSVNTYRPQKWYIILLGTSFGFSHHLFRQRFTRFDLFLCVSFFLGEIIKYVLQVVFSTCPPRRSFSRTSSSSSLSSSLSFYSSILITGFEKKNWPSVNERNCIHVCAQTMGKIVLWLAQFTRLELQLSIKTLCTDIDAVVRLHVCVRRIPLHLGKLYYFYLVAKISVIENWQATNGNDHQNKKNKLCVHQSSLFIIYFTAAVAGNLWKINNLSYAYRFWKS